MNIHEPPDGYGTSGGLDSRKGFSWVVLSGGSFNPTNPSERTYNFFTFPAHGDIMARAPSVRGPTLALLLLQLVLICSAQVRLTMFLSVSALSICLHSLTWQGCCRWVFSLSSCWITRTILPTNWVEIVAGIVSSGKFVGHLFRGRGRK